MIEMRGIRGRRACQRRVDNVFFFDIYLIGQCFSLQRKTQFVPVVLPSLSSRAVKKTHNTEDARGLKGLQLRGQLSARLG